MIIEKLNKNDFEEVFDIMKQSFPSAEYRPKHKQYAILDDKNYNVYVTKQDGQIKAFIAYWDVGNFVFAEHLAVSPDSRNRGVGSDFMKTFLPTLTKPLVLEIEDKDDEISKRRIGFYERLGLRLTDICYNQPNFDESNIKIPLRIMYFDKENVLDLSRVEQTIFDKIYKKS